jgi:hypothetical protein
MTTIYRNRKHFQKVRTTHKPRKTTIYYSGMEKSSKQNNIGQLTINNYTFQIQWRPLIIIADNVINQLLLSKSVVQKHSI